MGHRRGHEARALEERGRRKKLIEHAEWCFGDAGEIAAARARTERALQQRAERAGQIYISPFGPIPQPPGLLRENEDAWELFTACSSQLILGGMGGVAGVRHDSLPWRMDLMEIAIDERAELDQKFRLIEAVFVKHCNRDLAGKREDRG